MSGRSAASRALSTILIAALCGAALGSLELCLSVGFAPDASIGRRGPGFLAATCCLYALAGAALGALGALLAGRRRPELLLAVPLAGAALVLALAWIGQLSLDGEPLWTRGRRWRLGTLLALFLAGAALAWAIGAVLRARAARRSTSEPRATGRALALGALALLAVSAGLLLWTCERARGREDHPRERAPAPGSRPHVLVVVVDTLRADALSCYGAPPGSTPNLDRLAERGVLLEDVQSTASWTIPAVATLFTGRQPAAHGVGEFSGRLRDEDRTLAETLSDAGYDCTAFLGNQLVSLRAGFARGFRLFDVYDYGLEGELVLQRGGWEVARLLGLVHFPRKLNPVLRPTLGFPFLDTRPQRSPLDEDVAASLALWAPPERERPSATYMQLAGPHDPYFELPATFAKERLALVPKNLERLRELYAGEVTNTDRVLGEILASYEAAGILEDTLVVVTSDHGEEFLEHGGLQHGHSLHGEVVRVPCIVAGPGVARGRRVTERVSLTDLTPTLYELLGVPPPASCSGTSLAPLLRPERSEARLPARVYSELTSQILNAGLRVYCVIEGPWKVVRESLPDGSVRERIYDLRSDPLERAPLADPPPELAELRQSLVDYQALAIRAEEGTLDLENIKALGYGGSDE